MKKTLALLLLLAGLNLGAWGETLTWNGNEEHMTWNTEDTNWLQGDSVTKYTDGADVVFDNTGYCLVTLQGPIAPKSVLVKNSSDHSYLFIPPSIVGSGSLTGSMQLIKDGEGDLYIYTANDYSGGTLLKNGILVLYNDKALGSGGVTLMGATLNLAGHAISNNIVVEGAAHISSGTVSGNLSLAENATLTWEEGSSLHLTGSISLGNNTTFDLGGHTLSNNVNVNGTAHITNGTVSGNLNLADDASFTWSDEANLQLTGSISLGTGAKLDLGKHSISNDIILNGTIAYIGNGSISNDILAVTKKKLILEGDLTGTGNIILANDSKMDLGDYTLSNNVNVKGNATIGGGTLDGNLTVEARLKLCINDYLKGKGNIILESSSQLDLWGIDISNSVILNVGAQITGSGTISGNLILADNMSFSWNGSSYDNVQLTGSVTLENNAWFDLNGQTLSASVNVIGDTAFIRGGNLAGDLTIDAEKALDIRSGNLTGSGVISLEDGAQLNWTGQTLSGSIKLGKHSNIDANLGSSNTTIKTRESVDGAVLEKVSVSDGLIAGTDRQASLADGLYIQSEANLLIESMTITANNEIHVGEHTITLNQVTIDLSKAEYKLVDSDYYFQLQNLINCDLEMDDVVFDASALELPSGFDPAVNGIGIDFGTDVTIDPQTARNLTLLMGGDWSHTMSIDAQGRPVFTALVPTPEPATGTLSLLALAALCMRKRRK